MSGRGRHGTSKGMGFGHVLGWTAVGGFLPGTAHLIGGRKFLGTFLLSMSITTLVVLTVLTLTGLTQEIALRLAVRPNALLALAAALTVGGLLWVYSTISGHYAVRQNPLYRWQKFLAATLITSMVLAVAVPTVMVGRYAMVQRDLLSNVFGTGDGQQFAGAKLLKGSDPWREISRVNVLLMGSDAGFDRKGTRPDTLIVASIDTRSGDTVLISLPRNLENVPFPQDSPLYEAWPKGFNCGDTCMINAVWTWAEDNPDYYEGYSNPGLRATVDAVRGALGIDIDYYGMVNLQGFQDLVDSIGGLRMKVPHPIGIAKSDASYPKEWVVAGDRKLTGFEALWLARSRWKTSDYDRMLRQRCVIAAVVDQADPVALARAFPKLAASASKNIDTSIQVSELDAFVLLAKRVQNGKTTSLAFTDELIVTAKPDFDLMHHYVRQTLEGEPVSPPTTSTSTSTWTSSSTSTPGRTPSSKKTTNKPAETVTDSPTSTGPSAFGEVNDVCSSF